MKAIVYEKYGGPEVLKLKEIEKPTPNADEILVKIHATAVNSGDLRLRAADPFATRFMTGLLRPKIWVLGTVYSGVVEAAGSTVSEFYPGNEVFGHTDLRFGAYAEYICVPASSTVIQKPKNLTHEEAASIPFGGLTALHWIDKLEIEAGQKVLIYGASGAVGSALVQLAKAKNARVTAVCSSANTEAVKVLGADDVIAYTETDFSTMGIKYDVVIDAVNKMNVRKGFDSLARNGKIVLSAAGISEMIKGKRLSLSTGKKCFVGMISHDKTGLNYLKQLIEEEILKTFIGKTYRLEEVSKAHEYADKGHKKGSIVIKIVD